MSDSGGGVKQFATEMVQATGEVAKDFSDQVGQAIETGVQSVATPQLTPQQAQQKQQTDQQQEMETQGKLARIRAWFRNLQINQNQVIMENKQKEQQRIHAQIQQQQAKKAETSQMQGTKVPGGALPEEVARTRQEIGKGHGVGG